MHETQAGQGATPFKDTCCSPPEHMLDSVLACGLNSKAWMAVPIDLLTDSRRHRQANSCTDISCRAALAVVIRAVHNGKQAATSCCVTQAVSLLLAGA
jgi:hypothetical protein